MTSDVPHDMRIQHALNSGAGTGYTSDATFALVLLTKPTMTEIADEITRLRDRISLDREARASLGVTEPDDLLWQVETQAVIEQSHEANVAVLERVAAVIRNRDVALALGLIDPSDRGYPDY